MAIDCEPFIYVECTCCIFMLNLLGFRQHQGQLISKILTFAKGSDEHIADLFQSDSVEDCVINCTAATPRCVR